MQTTGPNVNTGVFSQPPSHNNNLSNINTNSHNRSTPSANTPFSIPQNQGPIDEVSFDEESSTPFASTLGMQVENSMPNTRANLNSQSSSTASYTANDGRTINLTALQELYDYVQQNCVNQRRTTPFNELKNTEDFKALLKEAGLEGMEFDDYSDFSEYINTITKSTEETTGDSIEETSSKTGAITSKNIGDWLAEKFKEAEEWTSQALTDTGAFISATVESAWPKIKDVGKLVWTNMKKIGASIVNGLISIVKGLVRLVEALGDLIILLASGITTIGTGLCDLIKGISTGDWDWSATKKLWGETKSAVTYDWTSKWIFDPLYETKFGEWLDSNAYSPFKSDGTGCKILEGVGYVAGVVVISIFTFGAGGVAIGTTATVGGVTVSAGGVGLTALAAGVGKHTQNAWNENSISINYGGTDIDVAVNYEKYSEIEELKPGESTTIIQQITLEDGTTKEIELKITSKGNGEYDIIDTEGNTFEFNSLKESSTAKGLGKGIIGGIGDGFKYYTAVSTLGNIQQFTAMAKAIGGGKTLTGLKTIFSNFDIKQSLKPLLKNAAKGTIKDVGFYVDSGTHVYTDVKSGIETGEWNLLKTGAKILGAYGINFLGNLGGEYFGNGLNTSLNKIDEIKAISPNIDFKTELETKLDDIDNQINAAIAGGDSETVARLEKLKSSMLQIDKTIDDWTERVVEENISNSYWDRTKRVLSNYDDVDMSSIKINEYIGDKGKIDVDSLATDLSNATGKNKGDIRYSLQKYLELSEGDLCVDEDAIIENAIKHADDVKKITLKNIEKVKEPDEFLKMFSEQIDKNELRKIYSINGSTSSKDIRETSYYKNYIENVIGEKRYQEVLDEFFPNDIDSTKVYNIQQQWAFEKFTLGSQTLGRAEGNYVISQNQLLNALREASGNPNVGVKEVDQFMAGRLNLDLDMEKLEDVLGFDRGYFKDGISIVESTASRDSVRVSLPTDEGANVHYIPGLNTDSGANELLNDQITKLKLFKMGNGTYIDKVKGIRVRPIGKK